MSSSNFGKKLHFLVPMISLAVLAMLSACTTPIVKETDAPKASEYVTWVPPAFKTPVEERLPKPKEFWWKDFESEELNHLVNTALTNNYDLRVAIARVSQARAQAAVVRSTLFPTVDIMPGYSLQGPGLGPGTAKDTTTWQTQSAWRVGALVNYETDIWGKQGFNTQSAISQALASEFNRESVVLGLVGDVISTYFTVVSLTERIAVGERNLVEIMKITNGLKRRMQMGDSTMLDVSQQLIFQNNTQALIVSQKLQRDDAFNRLAALMGQVPSSFAIKAKSVEEIKVALVTPGLPSDLLCRRPDIRRAESMLEASRADLYSARANILPSFQLTGGAGYGSFLLSTLAAPQSIFYSLGASFIAHVFDGGRRSAEERVADAKNVEMLEAYAGTVVSALRDVESALAGIKLTAEGYFYTNKARDQARLLAKQSERMLEWGGIDYIQLYEIQRQVFSAEDAAVASKADQLKASVDLYKSIGGGMSLGNDPCLGGGKLPPADPAWVQLAEAAKKASLNTVTAENTSNEKIMNTAKALVVPAALPLAAPQPQPKPLTKPTLIQSSLP